MIAVFVTIQLKPGFGGRCVEASRGMALSSARDEPGCFRFDVLRSCSDPNRFHLYEVFEDERERVAHRDRPHYKEWRSTVQDWFDGGIQVVVMDTAFPSDDGWRGQKSCGRVRSSMSRSP